MVIRLLKRMFADVLAFALSGHTPAAVHVAQACVTKVTSAIINGGIGSLVAHAGVKKNKGLSLHSNAAVQCIVSFSICIWQFMLCLACHGTLGPL